MIWNSNITRSHFKSLSLSLLLLWSTWEIQIDMANTWIMPSKLFQIFGQQKIDSKRAFINLFIPGRQRIDARAENQIFLHADCAKGSIGFWRGFCWKRGFGVRRKGGSERGHVVRPAGRMLPGSESGRGGGGGLPALLSHTHTLTLFSHCLHSRFKPICIKYHFSSAPCPTH